MNTKIIFTEEDFALLKRVAEKYGLEIIRKEDVPLGRESEYEELADIDTYAAWESQRSEFGSRVKELRQSRGMTQEGLALRLGVATSTVAMWETTDRTPPLHRVQQIANYFEVSVDYILGRTDVKQFPLQTNPERKIQREQQIEEMAQLLQNHKSVCAYATCDQCARKCKNYHRAVGLYDAGYRRFQNIRSEDEVKKVAAREFYGMVTAFIKRNYIEDNTAGFNKAAENILGKMDEVMSLWFGIEEKGNE